MANGSEFPTPPPLYCIRTATLEDVDRMAFVGIAGFRHTQIFEFERPHYEEYPNDTFKSFQKLFEDLICDPDTVVLVAEDEYDREEDSHTPTVQTGTFFGAQSPQGRVVVGIACWTYEDGSKRHGEFGCPQARGTSLFSSFLGLFSTSSPSRRRDEIIDRTRRVDEAVEAANKKYFKGCNILTKIVVHPAYWRRGHGSLFINWGKRLADMDAVDQGTLPSRMGEKIAFVEGFEHIDDIHVEGDELDPKGIDIAVGLYKFKARPSQGQ